MSERKRLRAALENILSTYNRNNIGPGQAAFIMANIAADALEHERVAEKNSPLVQLVIDRMRKDGIIPPAESPTPPIQCHICGLPINNAVHDIQSNKFSHTPHRREDQ